MAAILVFFCFHANWPLLASLSNVKFNRIFNLERGHKGKFAWKQKNTYKWRPFWNKVYKRSDASNVKRCTNPSENLTLANHMADEA